MKYLLLLMLPMFACNPDTKDTKDPVETGSAPDSGDNGRYHPDGWTAPAEHGMAAKYQDQACVGCHGDDLGGGSVDQSCDTCHAEGWRTDCTFCHGGTDNTTGAPPLYIDNTTENSAFQEHTSHVSLGIHAAWDCTQCHVKPTDVLSSGHLFLGDTTPGEAEPDLSGGLSPAGTFATDTCSNLYCHSNGAGRLGTITTGATTSCSSCHGSASSANSLSGRHADHLGEGVQCGECHADTITGNSTISDPAQHVDGGVDIAFTESRMSRTGSTCSGSCHGENHSNRSWTGGD